MAGLGALALRLRDPHESGAWGVCPFHAMTGAWCPGCGSLRAVNDLTHGDVLAAASSNLVFVLALPVLALLWVGWVRHSWAGTPSGVDGAVDADGVDAAGPDPGVLGGPQPAVRVVAGALRPVPFPDLIHCLPPPG